MAKSAKANSVFDNIATTLIPEGKKERKREPIERFEEKETVAQPTETANINNTQEPQSAVGNSGFSIKPVQKEAKSKRVNLVLQPSVYAKAQRIAKRDDKSVATAVRLIILQEILGSAVC